MSTKGQKLRTERLSALSSLKQVCRYGTKSQNGKLLIRKAQQAFRRHHHSKLSLIQPILDGDYLSKEKIHQACQSLSQSKAATQTFFRHAELMHRAGSHGPDWKIESSYQKLVEHLYQQLERSDSKLIKIIEDHLEDDPT